jgi:hypothetical protein
MTRRIVGSIAISVVVCAVLAAAAAANPIRLYMDQGAAFSVIGHSCGGIQEKVYVRGFAPNGYPQGNVELSTSCGGSGRGGGGGTTTYKGTASVVWTWFGETRSWTTLQGPLEATEATDAHGDRVYNVGAAAYLETGTPPLQPPAPPTITGTSVVLSDEPPEDLRLNVSWSVAAETARLLTSSTATATPVGSSAPVLSTTVSPYFQSAVVQPLETNTTYSVTVTNTDSEGTSAPSAPVEIKTPNSDGEAEKGRKTTETCSANGGTIALSPGITETPAIQKVTLKGAMTGCLGPHDFETGSYIAHLITTEPLTCSALSSASLEGTASKSFSITWNQLEGISKGSMIVPVSEAPLTGMTGSLKGGPFETATSMKAASVFESFTGASMCGQPQGVRKIVKPVKAGTFSTSEVEFG